MNEKKYLFDPKSRDRENLPKVNPEALEAETVEMHHMAGVERLLKGEPLTVARDLDGSHVLAWTDGRKCLVLVEKTQLGEELPWA